MLNLCAPCLEVSELPTIRVPRYLGHPEHGKRDTWDVRGEAVCSTCSTTWRGKRDNTPLSSLICAAALGLGLLAPEPARAGPLIQGGTETGTLGAYGANFMQGYDFVSTANQSLTALGFWDEGANGLPRSFQVGLWATATQALLASAVIDNADAIDPSVTVANGNWRYESLLTAVTLASGTTYTLGWQNGSPDLSTTDSLFMDLPTLVVDPNVTVTNPVKFLQTSAFTFPTEIGTSGLFRGMVNAQLLTTTSAAVPEPGSLALLGAALGAFGLSRRRKKA